jgi:hypothetical protein
MTSDMHRLHEDHSLTYADSGDERSLGGAPGATPSRTRRGAWEALARSLEPAWAAEPVDRVPGLPARLRAYVQRQGIASIGALLGVPYGELATASNMGRVTIARTIEAIVDWRGADAPPNPWCTATPKSPPADPLAGDLGASLDRLLAALSPAKRQVVALRAGVDRPPMTQKAIGVARGVTESRICQTETESLLALGAQRAWHEAFEARARATVQRSLPLGELAARDPWFAEVGSRRALLGYLLDALYRGRLAIFDLDGHPMVATFPRSTVDEVWQAVLREARARDLPPDSEATEGLLAAHAGPLGDAVVDRLRARLRALPIGSGAAPAEAYARCTPRSMVAAEVTLRVSPGPMPLDALAASDGRVHLPRSAVLLAGGLVTLAERLDGFDALAPTVATRCRDWIQARGPQRAWACAELMEALQGVALPDWFTPSAIATVAGLSATLRRTDSMEVALLRPVHDGAAAVLRRVLDEAGSPQPASALLRRAQDGVRVTRRALTFALLEQGFVEVTPGCWGLVERDLPGGAPAAAQATAEVRRVLEARGRGASTAALLARVRRLSPAHARWCDRTLLSVLRPDATFLLWYRTVALRAWDDLRCPTQQGALRACVAREGGRVDKAAIDAYLTETFGAPLSRRVLTHQVSVFRARARAEGAADSPR